MNQRFERASILIPWLPLALCHLVGTSCSETGTRVTDSGGTITTSGLLPDLIRARNERKRGLRTESEWNKFRMWKKIAATPPTFIPTQHSENSPRTDDDGQWFVDHRDGKKLFVPNYTSGPFNATTLAVEAAAIVDWQYSKGDSWYHHVDHRL